MKLFYCILNNNYYNHKNQKMWFFSKIIVGLLIDKNIEKKKNRFDWYYNI
jgi:hypothetical protein